MIVFVTYNSEEKAYYYIVAGIKVATIHFVLDKSFRSIIITSLLTIKEYRGKGYGTMLLQKVINYAKKFKYSSIILDDDSDFYRQKNNIYIKLGWSYIHNWGPEMIYRLP